MGPLTDADAAAAPDRVRELIERFTDLWDRALGGGPPPSVEAFLAEVREPDRAGLRAQLDRVNRDDLQRTRALDPAGGERTVDLPDPEAAGGKAADTHPDLDFTLDSAAETIDPPGGPAGGPVPAAGYEILGELGRGGMGVVYRARQLGLNRVVALKMVLSGAHASPHQIDRFRTEAEAVARLRHPHIVQIYEVGERDGLPFFSLEYLDGGSLADRIRREPQPPDRAARTAAQLALGVQYAHEHGIVHRDLKPANILFDADGVPKITDFGLAKKLEDGASSQTQSGTIMGSPSYMAPEQARGDVHEVGPGADVYSLGAILYELLTGRPPFLGSTLLETLEQVRSQEPVPPRELVPKVPRDLETIALKCLQKEPAKRYPSAGDLAEDLDRFRAGKPILARPVGAVERFARWCRRNPRTAGLTVAVVVSLVAGTVVSSAFAVGLHRERNQKEAERVRAEEARELADARRAEAEAAKREAQRNADEVLKQGKLALRSFGTLIEEVQKQIGDSPGTQALKLKLLETALDGLDKVAKSDEDSRLLGQSMAAAYMRIGQLFQQTGQSEKAFVQYEKCHAIVKALAAKDPDGPVAQANLAATLTMLGEMSLELRRDVQASLDYYQQALALRKAIAARPPDEKLDPARLRQDLAESHTRVGVTYLRLGEPVRAAGYFGDALAIREELAARDGKNLPLQLDVARSHTALGEVRFRARDWPAAKDHFARALAVCERVRAADPDGPRYQLELANTLGNIGVFSLRTGDLAEADKHLPRGQALMAKLAGLDAKNALYRRYLALADYRCATLARKRADTPAADRWNAECLRLRETLAADDPKSERRAIELLLVRSRTGGRDAVVAGAAKLEANPGVDREVLVELAQCYSQMAADPAADGKRRAEDRDHALALVRRALAQGYRDNVVLETDPDLDAVREAPGFRDMLSAAAGPKPGG
jgi:tetratricopeptide (TPR) repeat protein